MVTEKSITGILFFHILNLIIIKEMKKKFTL